ncbi:hypothetical protein NDR87_23290 [Nocardia sp. CDC159]|uniref:Uncharacterized protein n=1 Tax=Nocardia pulmonis TaxID=2951408 RepID=A0A9X2IZL5_9NOCA|nr:MULTISPECIES: hypothetical protein [Nocardia]MCM6776874.1 hypothetical protein [Nocardia pulmonis]MCM6789298.1 hypothetical protein [Nocardia sp. CDC159]
MTPGAGHPLAYPALTTIGALAICLAWAPFGGLEQVSLVGTVALIIVAYTAVRFAVAYGVVRGRAVPPGVVRCRRVRQQYRLVSRSWLEFRVGGRNRWLPVYFDPALVTLAEAEAEFGGGAVRVGGRRLYPSGAPRDSEPVGRLVDNPTRVDPEGGAQAVRAARVGRRLLLDAQSAVAAPFAGVFWVYVVGGGLAAFACATTVFAGAAVWFAAIRGSDPS